MNPRNFIAGLACAALAAMVTTAAFAEGPAKNKGFYVSGAVGANWANDSDVSGAASGYIDFDVDFFGNVAVGYGYGNGLRMEGELYHRRSEADDLSGTDLAGKASVSGFMFNVLYDFNVSRRFIPYIGLGAGLANVHADGVSPIGGSSIDDEDNVFAWQGILGVAIPLNDRLDFTADYWYFDADAQMVLDAAAAYSKRRGLARVNLAGHADRSGKPGYNMRLSLRRAQAVKAALLKLGVRAGDISLVGRGESAPLVSTADGVREPRNRRVEIAF